MDKKRLRKGIWSVAGILLLAGGSFVVINRAEASVACHKYKEVKKINTEENRKIYFKIKWIQDNQNDYYLNHYKVRCAGYEYMHKLWTGETLEICHDYYIHEEIEDYREYKDQCHDHKKEHKKSVTPTPEPAPEPEPEPEQQLD